MVVLVNADEVFFFLVYGVFPQAFTTLPRNWALGFSSLLVPAVLVGAQGVSALDDSGFVVSILGSALVAPAIGLFIDAIARQSQQRHEALVALAAAHDEAESLLQATLAMSRARTPADVVDAIGACLSGRGVERVALCADGDPVAVWAQGGGAPSEESTVAIDVEAPGSDAPAKLTLEVAGPSDLSHAGRRTLETLAVSCGLALANFELVERARCTGMAEERARLAREIHDTLAQGFVSVLTQLEAAGQSLTGGPPEAVERVRRASDIARSSLAEARRSVQALRPGALESAPLHEAIERVVARWSADAAVTTEVTVTGTATPLPPNTEVTLLRAAQEALANVARHSNATSVAVTLSYLGDAVVVDVHDDGCGFDVDAPRNGSGGGFGLQALRERVDALGGYFGLESEVGKGTTVTVHIPVSQTP